MGGFPSTSFKLRGKERGKNRNAGTGPNIPEMDRMGGMPVAASGRAIKAGLRAEIFERLD
jgi:hypothetical protein